MNRRSLRGAWSWALALFALSACGEPVAPESDFSTGGAPSGGVAPTGGVSGTAGTAGSGGTNSVTGGAAGAAAAAGGVAPLGGSSGVAGTGGSSAGNGPGGAGAGGDAAGNGGAAGTAGGFGGSAAGTGGTGSGGAAGTAGSGGAGGKAGNGGTGGTGATAAITIWIAGDSTVATGTNCPIGWGGVFDPLFNDRVTVTNSAVGGRSVRTWLYNVQTTMDSTGECVLTRDGSGNPTIQSRWQQMLTGMKSGDYLFIQFGINDGSATCDRHVGLAAFKESYGMMAQAAKDRGAQPIFVTPVSSISCSGSTARGTRGSYVTATVEAGTQYNVPVIDLHALSVALYNMRGFCPIPGGGDVSASTGGAVGEFFCDDHTHFDTPGATAIAGVVAQALRTQNIPLAAYLR